MTTKTTKPTVRETSAYVRQKGMRPLIATLEHGILTLRPKGMQQTETVDLGSVWQQAVKARVASMAAEKRKAKMEKRKALSILNSKPRPALRRVA